MARLGTVSYLNAKPLTSAIDRDVHEVSEGTPTEVAERLAAGDLDVALVPVGAVLSDGVDYLAVPRWCIGCEGAVESVLLVAERPPEVWTRVLLDKVSRTSVLLAQLLLAEGPLAERLSGHVEVAFVDAGEAQNQASGTTAALVIGDTALALSSRWTTRLDLGEVWHAWTGLPFVFAVWAGRPTLGRSVVRDLVVAGAEGTRRIDRDFSGKERAYLQKRLRYTFDDHALIGLRRFGAMVYQRGWTQRSQIEFFDPDVSVSARPSASNGFAASTCVEALHLYRNAGMAELTCMAMEVGQPGSEPGRVAFCVTADDIEDVVRVDRSRADLPNAVLVVGHSSSSADDLSWLGADLIREDALASAETGLTSWLPWAERAAASGMKAVAAVCVGAGESDEAFVERLFRLRRVQERTHILVGVRVRTAPRTGAHGAVPNTAQDLLRAVALTRLVLSNVPDIWVSPAVEGMGLAQLAVQGGANHFGALSASSIPNAERHIRAAGAEPVRLDVVDPSAC